MNFEYNQLESSGQNHVNRWMYQKCKLNGLKVKREDIRLLLQVIVPHAVDIRSRRRLKRRNYWPKGPNKYDQFKKKNDPYTCVHVYVLNGVHV